MSAELELLLPQENFIITQLQGDSRKVLRTLPAKSVHCAITSPPYAGQREYLPAGHPLKEFEIGNEPTLPEYMAHMLEVFKELYRVLRDDGSLWLNLGDKAATDTKWGGGKTNAGKNQNSIDGGYRQKKFKSGLPAKNIIGLPWRVAFALQEAGWILRQDIIWEKTNAMPQSVEDRPSLSHEYLFLLTKKANYFYDKHAIAEPGGSWHGGKFTTGRKQEIYRDLGQGERSEDGLTRNKRSVWHIASEKFSGKHYAAFPQKLVEPCLLAGTSAKGCCPTCGSPWKRVVKKTFVPQGDVSSERNTFRGKGLTDISGWEGFPRGTNRVETVGWKPTCKCVGEDDQPLPPIPCTVLDPFAGTGTVLRVAARFGRSAIGIDLNPDYHEFMKERTDKVQTSFQM